MKIIKVISWNIACLPKYININGDIENRLKGIIKFIELNNPDIVSLQEVFSENSRTILTDFFKKKNYNVSISPNTKIILNGGLLIASKYKIIQENYNIYKNYIGEDCFTQKGILHIEVKIGEKYIHFFNSHLNNDTPIICRDYNEIQLIKRYQLNEFLLYLYKIMHNNKYSRSNKEDILYIIAGDLNLDYQSDNYKSFINKLSKKMNICCNKTEIITDNIERKQVDYIINCYNKSKNISPCKIYTYDNLHKLSDHNPLIKKFIL